MTARGTVRRCKPGSCSSPRAIRYPFFLVLDGDVEIVEHSRGEPRTVAVHQPGEFTGDVDMLTGRAALVPRAPSRTAACSS